MPRDEGPSSDDLDRFSGETGYCPECGAEIWDLVDWCPKCRAPLTDGPLRRKPIEHEFQRKMIVVIVVLALLGFLALFVF